MNPNYSDLIAFLAFLLVIGLNIWIVVATINKALVKFIKPMFDAKNVALIRWQWAGLSTGDFKEGIWQFVVVRNGGASKSIYIYLYYRDIGIEKRVTARIDLSLFSIRKVVYSHTI